MRIIGWAYEGAIHCWRCTGSRYGAWLRAEPVEVLDREGNEVSPIWAHEERDPAGCACDTCHREIYQAEVRE